MFTLHVMGLMVCIKTTFWILLSTERYLITASAAGSTFEHPSEGSRSRRGMSARRGTSAHPVISGLETVSQVNPNLDLLILSLVSTRINKKLCLKVCFFYENCYYARRTLTFWHRLQ